jgi:hypothetical protein
MIKIKHSRYPEYILDYTNGTIIGPRGVITSKEPNGYMRVTFRDPKLKDKKFIHNELFKEILGYIPEGLMVDHINGIHSDNKPCNLRLVTQQENEFNKHRHKTINNELSNIDIRSKNSYRIRMCNIPTNIFSGWTEHPKDNQFYTYKKTLQEAIIERDKVRDYFNNLLNGILTLEDIIKQIF